MADDEERDEEEERTPARSGNEGVRIIGAEEAAAALEKGEVAGRRPEDAPRFGDVPPTPSGPRPPHRFPLPDSVDPASAVPRPPVASSGAVPPPPLDESTAAAPPPPTPPPPPPPPPPPAPEEKIVVAGDTGELQPWTDPPTGEIPRVLAGEDGDDLSVWSAVGSRSPRWRDSGDNWDEDFEMSELADDEPRVGALDSTRTDHSDIYDFAEPTPSGSTPAVTSTPEPDPDATPVTTPAPKRIRTRVRPEPSQTTGGGNETLVRIITGVGIFAVAIICFVLGTAWLALLSTVVVLGCAFEVFDVLRRAGYVPATLLGLVATLSIMGGTYWKGERALPLVLALTTITTFLWYLFGVVRARPTVNVAATLMAFGWVGLLGSFATLLLQSAPRHHGVGLLYGPVLTTVACDIGSFVAGTLIGTHALMPEVSPNKTWEGALGGLTGSLLAAVLIVQFIHPWNLKHAALLGLMVAVVAPLGDLSESLIKRDLGLKDMSSILPGHGGILDRMDAMLFVLPATYYLCQYLNIR